MRSKSWLIILVIGIVGLSAFGFLTKFALDSNPALVKMGKLKQALAEDFSSKGVKEVSVRAMPGRRGYEVLLESPRSRLPDPEGFVGEVAECFLRRYSGPAPAFLKLSLIEPSRLGCPGETVYFQKEVSLSELVTRLELRAALARMQEGLSASGGYQVRPAEPADPLLVSVEIPAPRDDAEMERVRSLLREKAREHLSAGRGRSVVLTLYGPGPKHALLGEERIERPQNVRRRPAGAEPEPRPAVKQGEERAAPLR
jgi:hypothetical protein